MYVLQASQHDVALLITVTPRGNELPKAILMAMTVTICVCNYIL